MPIVKVGMLRGKSVQYKKTVLDCIHKGLVDSLRIENCGIGGKQKST